MSVCVGLAAAGCKSDSARTGGEVAVRAEGVCPSGETDSCRDGMVPAGPEEMKVLGEMMTRMATAPEAAPLECSREAREGALRIAVRDGTGVEPKDLVELSVNVWPLLEQPVESENVVGQTVRSRRDRDKHYECEASGTSTLDVALPGKGEFELMVFAFFGNGGTAVFRTAEMEAAVGGTVELRLPDRGTIRGRLVDAASNQPIAGAKVSVSTTVERDGTSRQRMLETRTGADGRFEAPAEGRTNLILVSGPEALLLPKDPDHPIEVPAGGTTDLADIRMSRR